MCGGSPLILFYWILRLVLFLVVGEIHRRGELYDTRSPLSEPESHGVLTCVLFVSNVGEITQGRLFL